jgi:hypothetical protein
MIRILIFISILVAGGGTLDESNECKGEYSAITKKLLKGFYYDSAVRAPVIQHDEEMLIQEYHFTLFKMPKYHFGIDASALPKNGVVKIYKQVSKKERQLVYNSEKEGNPKEIHHEPSPDSRKYVIVIEIPEKATPGCITIALGYSMQNDSKVASDNKKPKVKIVD